MGTKLNVEEMLRLSQSKTVIYLDKRKSNIQAWVDSKIRLEIDRHCIENNKKKQDVVEQALTLYMYLILNDKLDEVIKKYLPKDSVKNE